MSQTSVGINGSQLIYPPIHYDQSIIPSSPNENDSNEIIYFYNDHANPWFIPNLNTSINISGTSVFSTSSLKGVTVDGIQYYQLLTTENAHNWKLQNTNTLSNFDFSLFTARAIPFPAISKNG